MFDTRFSFFPKKNKRSKLKHNVLFGSIEITDSCCHGQFHTQKTIIKDDYLQA